MAMSAATPSATRLSSSMPTSQSPSVSRGWFPLVLAGLFWACYWFVRESELTIFQGFFAHVGARLTLMLGFLSWWFAHRGETRGHKFAMFGGFLAVFAAATVLSDKSIGFFGLLFMAVPVVLTVGAVWQFLSAGSTVTTRRGGRWVLLVTTFAAFLFVRNDGIDGRQLAAISYRWSTTPEEIFLSQRQATNSLDATAAGQVAANAAPLEARPGDWLAYRGLARDSVVRGTKIGTDWATQPPREIWRQRVGPAWSSMLIVDGRLITQEQRGDVEAVVCLDAKTGQELWAHEDRERFWDGQGGAGPRATPELVAGRLYVQGASGLVTCLDGATGKRIWQRDVRVDVGASAPMWGFSSSPLVVDDVMIAYSGAKDGKGLVAYRCSSGEIAWTAAAAPTSYSSPQPAEIAGRRQVLFVDDLGLKSLDPATGKTLWTYKAESPGNWRAAQPLQIGPSTILLGTEDIGLHRLEITAPATGSDAPWAVRTAWTTKDLKPGYNDFVVHAGHVYGFDGFIFSCVDLESGKRRWRGGRYGNGQVLLLADQELLVVLSEKGEVVLLEAAPQKLTELGRYAAITGKTWNHPVLVGDRLYVRNDEEMACLELPVATNR